MVSVPPVLCICLPVTCYLIGSYLAVAALNHVIKGALRTSPKNLISFNLTLDTSWNSQCLLSRVIGYS